MYGALHYDYKLNKKILTTERPLQMLNTKIRISQNNPICGAEEKQPRLKKQHRLNLE